MLGNFGSVLMKPYVEVVVSDVGVVVWSGDLVYCVLSIEMPELMNPFLGVVSWVSLVP